MSVYAFIYQILLKFYCLLLSPSVIYFKTYFKIYSYILALHPTHILYSLLNFNCAFIDSFKCFKYTTISPVNNDTVFPFKIDRYLTQIQFYLFSLW